MAGTGTGTERQAKRKKDASSASPRTTKRVGEVDKILSDNPYFEVVNVEGYGSKIRCTITGHEMAHKKDTLNTYLTSKSYLRAVEGWYDDSKFEQYLPYIVPHKADKRKLFCLVTRIPLNKVPSQVAKHTQGKRFLKAKEDFDKRRAKEMENAKKRKPETGEPNDSNPESSTTPAQVS